MATVGTVSSPQRLRSATAIRDVFAARCVAGGQHVTAHVLVRADSAPPRVAVVAGRGVGNAVVRNRAKRRVRECLRRGRGVPAGIDVVISSKTSAATAPFARLRAEIEQVVGRGVRRGRDNGPSRR